MTRRAELWRVIQWDSDGVYRCMVYDVDAMEAHWFTSEDEARAFLREFRNGKAAVRPS